VFSFVILRAETAARASADRVNSGGPSNMTGEDKRTVSFEGAVSIDDAIAYLKSLQAALKKGTVYVQNGTEVVQLAPAGEVSMEVEARSKKEKQSIKFSLRWEKTAEPEEHALEAFAISDKEPEFPAVVIEETE
jgi:amphi-Trp domain-containing protein